MPHTLRDELAARVAAALASSAAPASEVARRAYAIADAMLRERAASAEDQEVSIEAEIDVVDPRLESPPHDPRWEVEPRWSLGERARRAQRAAERDAPKGPGLATAKPDGADPARRVS